MNFSPKAALRPSIMLHAAVPVQWQTDRCVRLAPPFCPGCMLVSANNTAIDLMNLRS